MFDMFNFDPKIRKAQRRVSAAQKRRDNAYFTYVDFDIDKKSKNISQKLIDRLYRTYIRKERVLELVKDRLACLKAAK